jgi:hypothetical protein
MCLIAYPDVRFSDYLGRTVVDSQTVSVSCVFDTARAAVVLRAEYLSTGLANRFSTIGSAATIGTQYPITRLRVRFTDALNYTRVTHLTYCLGFSETRAVCIA